MVFDRVPFPREPVIAQSEVHEVGLGEMLQATRVRVVDVCSPLSDLINCNRAREVDKRVFRTSERLGRDESQFVRSHSDHVPVLSQCFCDGPRVLSGGPGPVRCFFFSSFSRVLR